ncbi:glycosyltransferase [Gabonia massiliensis]|uniref:glycosyltransferase n=1 Tax=Gabonia massiliensis TaxID=1686296 RepID=UPI0006D7E384|nr:glycosyltransferase [Gabonia massiliensis]
MNEKIVVFIRKKRPEANSIEEIFHSLIKYLGHEVRWIELPYDGASISAIAKNIWFARKHRGDINHITGEVHYIALGTGRRTLITVHDVQSIIKGGRIERTIKKWLWFNLPLCIARKISVISSFTKNELIELCPFTEKKISVVNNPINDLQIISAATFHKTASAKKTILHVGTKTNKNLEGVLKAITNLSVRLIIIGPMTLNQEQLADSLNVKYENYYNLPYFKVLELYKQADIITFPSFYEGFGMPIIEANLIGIPILTSDIEVVNPYSIDNIRNGIIELLENNELRRNLITLGKKNIRRFSPQNIAEQYKSLYNQL